MALPLPLPLAKIHLLPSLKTLHQCSAVMLALILVLVTKMAVMFPPLQIAGLLAVWVEVQSGSGGYLDAFSGRQH